MAINVKLFRKIQKHILAEPKRINMKKWCISRPKSKGGPACETAGCMAGWAVLLSTPKKEWKALQNEDTSANSFIEEQAMGLLGINPEQAKVLFVAWGDDLHGKPYTKTHAKSVAARIDAFLADHS